MKYAFFDLDGTLIPVDSSILWARTLLSHVNPKDRAALVAERAGYDEDYKNGCLDINKLEDFESRLLARFPRRELDSLREEYMKKDIIPYIMPIAVDLVEQYRRVGVTVVMVTASFRYPVEPIAEIFDLKDVLCAESEMLPNGEFTGRWLKQNFSAQKIVSVMDFIQARGGSKEDLKESVFFSDSFNDFPLLDFLAHHGGKAVATNPDERLRAEATQRQWEILDLFMEHHLF